MIKVMRNIFCLLSLSLSLYGFGKESKIMHRDIGHSINVQLIAKESFSNHAKSTVDRYEIKMILLSAKEMDEKLGFLEIDQEKHIAKHDSDLFCLIKISIKNTKNYRFIRHASELNFLDEEFRIAGLDKPIKFNTFSINDSNFMIFKLNLHKEQKKELLKKKTAKIQFTKMQAK